LISQLKFQGMMIMKTTIEGAKEEKVAMKLKADGVK